MKKNRGNGVVESGYVFMIRILRSSDMNQATKKAHEPRTRDFWKLPTSSTFQIPSFNCFLLEVSGALAFKFQKFIGTLIFFNHLLKAHNPFSFVFQISLPV